MSQSETPPNQLAMLKDIHLPPASDQFELAFGWWLLMLILLLVSGYAIRQFINRRRALAPLKPARQELAKLAICPPDTQALAELSGLLKRVCLLYFPPQQVAALCGEKWIEFLNQQVGKPLFDQSQQALFSQLSYQPNQPIENNRWQQLIANSQLAITTIIQNAAKQKGRIVNVQSRF